MLVAVTECEPAVNEFDDEEPRSLELAGLWVWDKEIPDKSEVSVWELLLKLFDWDMVAVLVGKEMALEEIELSEPLGWLMPPLPDCEAMEVDKLS